MQLSTFNRIPHVHRKENGLAYDQKLSILHSVNDLTCVNNRVIIIKYEQFSGYVALAMSYHLISREILTRSCILSRSSVDSS